jgi:hypothetical protein
MNYLDPTSEFTLAEHLDLDFSLTLEPPASEPVKTPLVGAVGVGVDSVAYLVGLWRLGIRPDLLLFADTGSEKQETYDYIPVLQAWLAKVGFPPLITVRNTVKSFKHYPAYGTLEENCLTNATLPSLAYGGLKGCSVKWKVEPQNAYCEDWAPAVECWESGGKVRKIIGYDNSPKDRRRYGKAEGHDDPRYDYWYPLIEWGWDREECKRQIAAAGLPVPIKSACFFCPSTKPEEMAQLKLDYLHRIVVMEYRAQPYLEGFMNQDQLDARHAVSMQKYRDGKRKHEPKRKLVGQSGLMKGLWGAGTKGIRGPYRPGTMTEYIVTHGLMTAERVEEIQAATPQEQVPFDQGHPDMPDWHDFLELFTAEDGLDELHGGCGGCEALCNAINRPLRANEGGNHA